MLRNIRFNCCLFSVEIKEINGPFRGTVKQSCCLIYPHTPVPKYHACWHRFNKILFRTLQKVTVSQDYEMSYCVVRKKKLIFFSQLNTHSHKKKLQSRYPFYSCQLSFSSVSTLVLCQNTSINIPWSWLFWCYYNSSAHCGIHVREGFNQKYMLKPPVAICNYPETTC